MSDRLLIGPGELAELVKAGECLVFDCRFDLQHPGAGRNSWLAAHIPGAVYANTDEHLAGPVTARSGRHPLPTTRSFAAFLARSGWRKDLRVVAYDAHGGAYAARLWWLLKYFGLGNATLLDGGLNAWMKAGLPLESGATNTERRPAPVLERRHHLVLKTQEVVEGLAGQSLRLVDARGARRFRGEVEPIDPVAGHVPGALNHPFEMNLEADRRFKPAAALASGFARVAARIEPERLVHMCGSGITACQNIFAMELAGIEGARLYAGSWSEWIRNPSRPVALGPDG